MKTIFVLLLLISNTYANSVKIKVTPERPVLNESFNVDFIIEIESDEEPIVEFNPVNIDVVSQSSPSISTRASYINGEVSVKKTVTYTYEMQPIRSGAAYLNSIKVLIGDKRISVPSKLIQILKQAAKEKKIFVKAHASKNSVYVGESIIVRYYLYNREDVPITSADIKKFPKLDKFLKRFHQENMNQERVSLDGRVYRRRLMYTAQLYAGQPGDYEVDSLTMKVGYSSGRNAFGGFGFNLQMGRQRTNTLASPPLTIEVLPLPAIQIPSSYTGLVGKHQFDLKVPRNRFITNEPIEMELTIQGPGALELFEAPTIIANAEIEEFEKTGDLVVNQDFTAQKKIKYTYLGRSKIELPKRDIELTYFDPELKTFVPIKLNLPEIRVAGGSSKVTIKKADDSKPAIKQASQTPASNLSSQIGWKPAYTLINTYIFNIKEIVIFLLILILLVVGYYLLKTFKNLAPKNMSVFDEIYSLGLDYSRLHKVLSLIDPDKTMKNIVKDLDVEDNLKVYLVSAIDKLDENYNNNDGAQVLKVKKKLFKKLEKYIDDNCRQHSLS